MWDKIHGWTADCWAEEPVVLWEGIGGVGPSSIIVLNQIAFFVDVHLFWKHPNILHNILARSSLRPST